MPLKSQRTDGRGHWPAGKRRNEDAGGWSAIRLAVTALVDNHYRVGMRSYRAIADAIGITDRSVRKHLSGAVRPAPELQELYGEWAKEQRRLLNGS